MDAIIMALYVFDVIYDPYKFPKDYEATEGDDSITKYNNELECEQLAKTVSLFQELSASRRNLFRYRNVDYFEELTKDEPESLRAECYKGKCNPERIKRQFCEKCGICSTVRSVRKILLLFYRNIPNYIITPILEAAEDKEIKRYIAEPRSTLIDRTMGTCTELCFQDVLRVNGPVKPPSETNSSLADEIALTYEYVIQFPEMYRCRRRKKINTFRQNLNYWLNYFDEDDVADQISNLFSPMNTACFYDDDDLFEDEYYAEQDAFMAFNEEI